MNDQVQVGSHSAGTMRICIMVTSAITANAFLRGYLSSLRDLGWQVALVCAPGEDLTDLAAAEGVALHTVPMRRDPSPLHDLMSLGRVTVILRRLRPDVLVYATPKASLLGAIGGRIAGVRARVYEQWGLRLETATGLSYRMLAALEWLTSKLSTSIVANSQSLAARIRELGVNAGRDVEILGHGSSHGVDAQHFHVGEEFAGVDPNTAAFLESDPAEFTIGFVGRLHPDKGIDTLLEALEICAKRGLKTRALLVGSAEGAKFETRLEALQGRVGVRLVGEVSDTRPYIEAMDVLVLMSRREGFPNVVLEAAAMNTPAVVADSTGTIDSVKDGVTGIVVPTGSAEHLASSLILLAGDRPRLMAMGHASRARIVSEFSQDTVWKLHQQHFAAEVEKSRRRGK